jgi:putative DNA methylase
MTKHRHLFTDRQLVALSTFSELVMEARTRLLVDGGSDEYADAVATYLGLAVDRCADYSSRLSTWVASGGFIRGLFSRQAIQMSWDYAETNVFSEATGNYLGGVEWAATVVDRLPHKGSGSCSQVDATAIGSNRPVLYATDPPYYDNIGYADLSDFFYVWLRRTLKIVHPDLFSTLLVPKVQELVADPYRHDGNRRMAEKHFESGISVAFERMRQSQVPGFPLTVIYAFKQAEESDIAGTLASTGWETMLQGLIRAGLSIHGTWPLRTERGGRMRDIGSSALASSIALVCRARPGNAPLATRKELMAALKSELPDALRKLQSGNIAPVDLAQSAIGPGMSVFSRYSKVVEADGSAMTVRTALGLINQVLDETLSEQEGDFDGDTRWALAWFEESGMNPGPYGKAETLSKAKNTSISGLVQAGFLESKAGKVRLLARSELAGTWDPAADQRLTVWEVTQHLILALEGGGEAQAASLLRRVGGLGETAKELAYRLYVVCERKKWASEALAYNALVVAWPEISRLAAGASAQTSTQPELL